MCRQKQRLRGATTFCQPHLGHTGQFFSVQALIILGQRVHHVLMSQLHHP